MVTTYDNLSFSHVILHIYYCTKSLSLMGDDKVTVSIGEVVEAIGKQKKGKSAGPCL